MRTALVVGGTGPTGPLVVNGLLERGYEVSIFHGGFHEVEFSGPVRHIHGDPHFPETIDEALGREEFDLTVAQYGRLRHLARHLAGKTGHLIGIGAASGHVAQADDPRWGLLGRPAVLYEEQYLLEDDIERNKFGYRIAEAFRTLMEGHANGDYVATYVGYPRVYGPGQVGPSEWSIVRRILDGRRHMILADGGLKLRTRAYTENISEAPLLAADRPSISGGKSYIVADRESHTYRQWVEGIARHLGHDLEIVEMPFEFAQPCYPLYEHLQGHRAVSSQRIRDELGYTDKYSAEQAVTRTVEWLIHNRPEPGGEVEQQLGDPFAYQQEDELLAAWSDARAGLRERLGEIDFGLPNHAHPYRHPKKPNESWTRPETMWR